MTREIWQCKCGHEEPYEDLQRYRHRGKLHTHIGKFSTDTSYTDETVAMQWVGIETHIVEQT